MDTTMQQLVDRAEITDLVNNLGRVLDEGCFAELRSLLVEDATARTPGGEAAGREALVAQAGRNHRPEQPIQHLVTNVAIDLHGDRASARANLVVHFGPVDGGPASAGPGTSALPPAPPVEFTMGEVYHFALVRTAEGWRFDRIETTPIWTSGTYPRLT
jgi:hypothetical protein